MRNLYIGSLKIHDINATSSDFWLQPPLDGFEEPEYRISTYEKPGEDGGVVSSMFYSSRTISLPGRVKGDTSALFEANRQALASACAIQKDSNGYPIPTVVTFTTLAGNTYFFNAYFNKPVFNYDNINWSSFLLSLIVPSPFIFSNTQTISTAIGIASGGGFILPVILPIVSAGSTGGTITLNNNGNATSYPIVTLTGPLTNPYFINTTINKSMQLNYSLVAGDVVKIDMLNKTIMLNTNSSILSTKSQDSEWWGLPPGNNTINFSSGSTSDTGTLSLSYYPAFLGV